ncbi:TPA: NAD-dependent DNA ligase LigA [Candidatus Poribacteria bacterium]|nr:NAD-dependent DNA ligase LigA [Candidatus Poribacteria bacterium]HIO50281.1 NAD-dependent DNA ligase LigA [Candidatus Poribacteria bacterium]
MTEDQVRILRDELHYHEHKYYVENQPEISDVEFDMLMKVLEKLEKENPSLITPNSPTQRVGGQMVLGERIRHHGLMLSLENTYTSEELYDFDRRIRKTLPDQEIKYVVELKVDGLGVALNYEDGYLSYGLTRGDGDFGEDVTANVRTIKSIPLKLKQLNYMSVPSILEVRGEVFIPKSQLGKVNELRINAGESPFANTRNAAAGSLRLLDSNIVTQRPLDIFIYRLSYGVDLETHDQGLEMLVDLGFKVNEMANVYSSMEEVIQYYYEWRDQYKNLDYDTDGIVVKVNNINHQELLGVRTKSPRWAICCKFPASQATTRINQIEIQVGRTGVLTPVATLDPVEIAGARIKNATLHNEQEITRKDIRVGDWIVLERSGDVIPKVVSVLAEKRSGWEKVFRFPNTCPSCGEQVQRSEQETAIRCINVECPDQRKRRIEHFVSRNALNIEGLGKQTVKQLIEVGLVSNIADLYHLQKDDLLVLEGFGDQSAENLISAIASSKQKPASRVLFGLGILHVGQSAADLLIDYFVSIGAISVAEVGQIGTIHGIGSRTAESVVDFFAQPDNRELFDQLKLAGLRMRAEAPVDLGQVEGSFLGKTFVLTGTLIGMTRSMASERIKLMGGKVSSNVSKNTDFLVGGENAGNKKNQAIALGIQILTEDTFLEMIDSV